jgi:XisI protein
MERLDLYRNCIKHLLEEHSKFNGVESDVESEIFFDSDLDRYQLMRVGWNGLKRIYYTVMHFDIKNDRIWIQQNTTDIDVALELVEMGVPKSDIVLGLHPPYKRPYTGYGVV